MIFVPRKPMSHCTQRGKHRPAAVRWTVCTLTLLLASSSSTPLHALVGLEVGSPGTSRAQSAPAAAGIPLQQTASPGVPLEAKQIANLLPETVYFHGKSAALQLRNAAAVRLAGDALIWIALVDTSGYATDVQERYQFYLVTEGPLEFGGATVLAGAYGGGFVGKNFVLMDLGGHTLAQGPLASDAALKRPRPLQLVPETQTSIRLYLGRRWVLLSTPASVKPPAGL